LTTLLKLHLEHTGRYDVRVENDGRQALEAAEEFRPDLILLDLVVPETTGWDILERIRAHQNLRDTPVMLLTADVLASSDPRRPDCLDWIMKPVRAAEVVARIDEHLA
jgi:putative two-component system response regulator